jgi:guanylate kinase
MEKLLEEYPHSFGRPIQYTTRKPRNDKELDIYVFLTRTQFMDKLDNGDFAEFTEYN